MLSWMSAMGVMQGDAQRMGMAAGTRLCPCCRHPFTFDGLIEILPQPRPEPPPEPAASAAAASSAATSSAAGPSCSTSISARAAAPAATEPAPADAAALAALLGQRVRASTRPRPRLTWHL
jgi:hypothetical protein